MGVCLIEPTVISAVDCLPCVNTDLPAHSLSSLYWLSHGIWAVSLCEALSVETCFSLL